MANDITIKLVSPVDQWLFPSNAASFAWEIAGDVEEIALSVDGAAVYPSVESAENGVSVVYSAALPDGTHTVELYAADGHGGGDSSVISVAAFGFITDRTAEDAALARKYAKDVADGTVDMRAFLAMSLKGAYEAEDMNRVSTAVYWLTRVFNRYYFRAQIAHAKNDWEGGASPDTPTPEQLEQYRKAIETLRGDLQDILETERERAEIAKLIRPALPEEYTPYRGNLPKAPESMLRLTTGDANRIEELILIGIDTISVKFRLDDFLEQYTHPFASGEIAAGEA